MIIRNPRLQRHVAEHPALKRPLSPHASPLGLAPKVPFNEEFFSSLLGARYKAWTPRANLSFRLNDSLMVYGGWSRGYTSGGFNIGAPSISPTADEEKLDSWEVGFRSDWFDNRLRLNVAAYYSYFENIQILVQRQDAAGNFSQQLVNAAEAEITGFEVEMLARPLDNLMLSFGWAVTDADYKEFNDLTPPPLGSPPGLPPQRSTARTSSFPTCRITAST